MKVNIRLLKRIKTKDPEFYESTRCKMIEEEIAAKVDPNGIPLYKTSGAEPAILRKQLVKILTALEESGVDAWTEEFKELNKNAELAKTTIKDFLNH